MANDLQNIYTGETQIQRSTQTDMMISRQTQEVQAAVVIAKKFPRDEYEAMERIKRACQRKVLAEQAVYTYPRGGKKIEGPSIRLAEAIAKAWGNIDTGIIELERKEGRSELMAYAWDLETNTRVSMAFSVDHTRDTKSMGKVQLTDDRDIYEATANFGARRMRSCILRVIPGDVVEMALAECRKTCTSGNKEPMKERLDKLLEAFKRDLKINREQLEEYCDRQFGSFGEEEIYILKGVYKAIRDGQAKVEDYFPIKLDAPDPLGNNGEI